tara:strand:+ start:380 stop:673 length:294 start_codon:yes stop_codon:yes gene_type:complete
MAGYVPNYQKKNKIAAKRERELLHAIRHNFDQDKILLAAQKFQDAKIAAAKSRWAQRTFAPSHDFSAEAIAKEDKRLAKWVDTTPEKIAETYARKES